jgi:KDO2-lipid IV(A) lauroyltransferase
MASLPLKLGYALAAALTELHYRAFPSRRHAALANLAVILPGKSRRERARVVRRMMCSYNKMLFEFFRLPHLEREDLLRAVETRNREHLERAAARGKGVIITCTHLGNWELAAVVAAHWGYTLNAVAGVQLNRWLSQAVRETKTELAIQTVSSEDGFRKLDRALERNEIVALMVDGDLFAHGQSVDFFGRDTRWPSGPGVLAQRTGASVLCGYCERVGDGRFRITFEPAIDPTQYPTAEAINARVAEISSRHIREHVDQWCIFRTLWEPAAARSAELADARRRATA